MPQLTGIGSVQPCALVMEGTRPGDTKSRYPQPAFNHVALQHLSSLHFFPQIRIYPFYL